MAFSRNFRSLAAVPSVLAVFAGVPGLHAQDVPANGKNLTAVVNSNNQFALDFYRKINASDAGKNIFVSPYSISTALAMTFEGSRNNTQKEMASVLHFNLPDQERQAGYAALLAETKAGPGKHYKLEVANALWGQKDYPFEPAFTSIIGKFYGGGFNSVDYAGDKAGSIHKINIWVEDKTAGKIRDLIHPDDINKLTKLVLTNAIYFKGDWASQFKKDATKDEAFNVSAARKVQVPMMRQTGQFLFVKEDGMAAIELPYVDNELSMIAILPDGDAKKLGESLSLDQIQTLRSGMRSQEVDVFLPRFKFETRYLLKPKLSDMGMPEAFNKNLADFTGITGHKDLYLFQVIHQAMIDVNEEGSEAAAATAVVMNKKTVQFHLKEVFRADRPFIFMIVQNSTGSILFMGRVSNPVSKAPAEAAGK
jgi:serpin B